MQLGVIGLGAAFAAAGALVGGRGSRVGMFASIATLAVPTLLWHAWIANGVRSAISARPSKRQVATLGGGAAAISALTAVVALTMFAVTSVGVALALLLGGSNALNRLG